VDEVGQYIADNTKLMTNLQTIAESLATKCNGRAWIIVTAQEDMTNVIGMMSKSQGNDFSKIQARFHTKMKLTSADVSEVIQKRLLLKNERGINLLEKEYHTHHNNFKTLFDFVDGSTSYRNYKDMEDFIHSYPFISYQYDLFQTAIQSLSDHNAFEGKHSSVGERSMLGVFQQVAMKIVDSELGQLATFDLMYEGVRNALKSQIQSSISMAERNLSDDFAVKVLKALFLVKYVKGFKATPRNVSILMLKRFKQNIEELLKHVKEALKLLENQSYLQRTGDEYEFLTNEEKDIENEIKNTDIENKVILDELNKIIFDTILTDRKIKYNKNGQFFSFSKKIDDDLYSREQELAIHIASSFNDVVGDEHTLRNRSMGRAELLIIMPAHERMISDISLFLRTEKYVRLNYSKIQQESKKRILSEKQQANLKRKDLAVESVKMVIGTANMYVGGSMIDVISTDPKTRILQGFNELIRIAYPNLSMLPDVQFKEQGIKQSMEEHTNTLFSENTNLSEAELEIFTTVKMSGSSAMRTTLKTIVDKFEKKPYGWYLDATRCLIAKLSGRGKIELRSDSNILSDDEVVRVLKNTQSYGNTIIVAQEDFSQSQIRKLKDLYNDLFELPAESIDAKSLALETKNQLAKYITDIDKLYREKPTLSFLEILEKPLKQLTSFSDKAYNFYLKEFVNGEDELLDMKEDIIDPVMHFMKSSAKQIYKDAQKFYLHQKPNFDYIGKDNVEKLKTLLNSETCFKTNIVNEIKQLHEDILNEVDEKIKKEKAVAKNQSKVMWGKLSGLSNFEKLEGDDKERMKSRFFSRADAVFNQNLIANIRDALRRLDENEVNSIIDEIDILTTPKPVAQELQKRETVENFGNVKEAKPTPPAPKPISYIQLKNVQIQYEKMVLETDADIDHYISLLKEKLQEEIKHNKKIRV